MAPAECGDHLKGFLRREARKNKKPEELVERFAMAADAAEDGVRRANQQEVRTFDQAGAQAVNLAFVAELHQYGIQVLHEQDWALAAFPVKVRQRGPCVSRKPSRVTFVLQERVRPVRPLGIFRGTRQMAQGCEPEVREVAYAVAFLVERDRLPFCGEAGAFGDSTEEPKPERGLPHAPRADQHHVLARAAAFLPAQQFEHALEDVLSRGERLFQLLGGQLRRIVETPRDHAALPDAWCFRHHSRTRFERKQSRLSWRRR